MNIPFQIGLGLLPGAIFILILLMYRRAFSFGRILFCLGTAFLCGFLLFHGFRDQFTSRKASSLNLTREQMLHFAGALAVEGATEEAGEVLSAMEDACGSDDACLLMRARIAILDEDYEAARVLYGYLRDHEDPEAPPDLDDELTLLAERTDSSLASGTDPVAAYLSRIGEDPAAYGYTPKSLSTADPSTASEKEPGNAFSFSEGENTENVESQERDAFSALRRKIRKELGITDEEKDAARAVAELGRPTANILSESANPSVAGQYDLSAVSSSLDLSEGKETSDSEDTVLKRYRRLIRRIEENSPEYLSLPCVKKARIKAYILAGDYKALAAILNTDSSYHEAMIAAELYMGGFVKSSDFSEEFRAIDREEAQALSDRVYDICKEESRDLNKQEKKRLKNRVTALEKQLKDPALCAVKELLIKSASEEAGDDQTKVCLALAKIEDYSGNEISTDQYLGEAISSSQSSPDDSYVAGMAGIISVIDSDDPESIKHVSEYVDTVLDHSLTVDVEKIIHTGDPEPAPTEEEPEDRPDFARTAIDYVARVRTAISIGRIDTSKFEEVSARVQIDTSLTADAEQLKKLITVYDCNTEIRDFSLEKINYTGTNILLLCDVSGSMDVAIHDLKNAVLTFISDQNDKEQLSIVTFSGSINERCPFGSSDAELTALAEGMGPSGGTNMYDATLQSLPGFPAGNDKTNNVLVLMTDGQDGNRHSDTEIRQEIGALADKYNATIYTLGLGPDVDAAYLTTIANCAGGEFIYVSDSASLSAFYDRLHAQMNAQYLLKYKAMDTVTMRGRTLQVELEEEDARDQKTYSLLDDDETGEGDPNSAPDAYTDLSIQGLSPRAVYHSKKEIPVFVRGTGFAKEDEVQVKFRGNLEYSLKGEYEDASAFKILIPTGMASGTYDVEISVNGKKRVFPSGFSMISDRAEKKTVFGPYVFTSQEKIKNGNGSTLLRGMVTLNGWLHFKGDLMFSGDPDTDAQLIVTDQNGSYIEYDPSTAEGLAGFFAEKGFALDIPKLNTFTLYNDPAHRYDYENYLVDDISTPFLDIVRTVKLQRVTLRLYPDSFGIYYKAGTTNLPYQDRVLKFAAKTEMFTLDTDGAAVLTDKRIGLILDVDLDNTSQADPNENIKLLNLTTKFNGSFKLHLNTLKEEFLLGLMIKFPVLRPTGEQEAGIGAEIEWKGHLYPDAVRLKCLIPGGLELPTPPPVQISVDDFSVGVSDIGSAVENGNFLNLVFEGTFSLSSFKVKNKFPALEPFFGDMSFLEMPDTKVTLRLYPFTITADATLNFLSEITLANASVKIGRIDEYSNQLLGINSEEVTGLTAALKTGLMWNSADDSIKVDLSGTGKLDAHTRFVGIGYGGGFSYDINWWFINIENNKSGEFAMGFYLTHSNKLEFVVVGEAQNVFGKNVKKAFYIDQNGHIGKTHGNLE